MHDAMTQLRRQIDALSPPKPDDAADTGKIMLGAEQVDRALDGGLAAGMLHEAYPATAGDMAALTGFAAGLASRITEGRRKALWVRQRVTAFETGRLHAPGLAAMGLDPAGVIFFEARNAEDVLRAGLEAVRCTPLGTVVMEIWGTPRVLDLTATRRLGLAAERSGVTPLLLRVAAEPHPSAAATRWQVASAPSRALAANAPGAAAFELCLLRNRAGTAGQRWHLEWDHERTCFRDTAPLSGSVVSVSAQRPAAADGRALARTG